MANMRAKKTLILALVIVITTMAFLSMFTLGVYAEPHLHKPKVGVSYVLKHSKFIYRNHTKDEGIKKRRELNDATKKHTVKGIKKAKLKKGTIVTCLEIHKKWIRIPSGWIKIKEGDLKRVKKERRY